MIELTILVYLIGGSAILVRAAHEVRTVRPEVSLPSSWWLDLLFYLVIYILNPLIWVLIFFSTRRERKRLA